MAKREPRETAQAAPDPERRLAFRFGLSAESRAADWMFAAVRIRPKSPYLPWLFSLECVDAFALIRHNPASKYGSKAGYSWRALCID
jgi:hypothetical protein